MKLNHIRRLKLISLDTTHLQENTNYASAMSAFWEWGPKKRVVMERAGPEKNRRPRKTEARERLRSGKDWGLRKTEAWKRLRPGKRLRHGKDWGPGKTGSHKRLRPKKKPKKAWGLGKCGAKERVRPVLLSWPWIAIALLVVLHM